MYNIIFVLEKNRKIKIILHHTIYNKLVYEYARLNIKCMGKMNSNGLLDVKKCAGLVVSK